MKTTRISILFLLIATFLVACETTNNNNGPNSITLDGQNTTWQAAGIGWSASIGTNYTVAYTCSFIKTSTYPSIRVMYGDHVYATYSQANFFAFFTTGTKSFATDPSTDGFIIYYTGSSTGPTWSSAFGSQSGSSVTFNSFSQEPASGANPDRVKFNVTVNAKMYNTVTPTDIKNVSGTFEGHFEKY